MGLNKGNFSFLKATKRWPLEDKIIKENWDEFKKAVIPNNAPPIQVSEMRSAFYAGVQIAFNEIIRISVECTEVEAQYKLDKLEEELEEYAKTLMKKMAH